MKNLIDNPINEVMDESKLYKIIATFASILIAVLCICVYQLIQEREVLKGRINNLETANNSKNYMLNNSL